MGSNNTTQVVHVYEAEGKGIVFNSMNKNSESN